MRSSTTPVGDRPLARCTAASAALVPLPNLPSAPWTSGQPIFMIACWSWATSGPVAPSCSPTMEVAAAAAGAAGAAGAAVPFSAADVAASSTPLALRPLDCWNVMSARRVPAPKIPSIPPVGGMPAAVSASCSWRTFVPRAPSASAPPAPRGSRNGGRRRRRGEAEGRGGCGVDDAGHGEALVALERPDRRLGRRAEVAVDAVLDADADAVERVLEGPDGLAAGTLGEPDDLGGGDRRGRRRRARERDADGPHRQPGRQQHGRTGATSAGTADASG